ncbi:hypothetical protein B0H21DRAFT_747687 [Amylocystis lapponica]|nr:hypothetical protein B0H21DRAFT_747687 [Amylocystis lapponica]
MHDKAAEFARLHEFFTSLASGDFLGALSKTSEPIPPPVISRSPLPDRQHTSPAVGPKPVTAEEWAAFATDPNYEFTFKLMVHDLYGIVDFSRMVDGVLQASRLMYKPLAEGLKGQTNKEKVVVEVPEVTEMDVRADTSTNPFGARPSVDHLDAGVHGFVTSLATTSEESPLVLGSRDLVSRSSKDKPRTSSSANSSQATIVAFGVNDDTEERIIRPRAKRPLPI